MTRRLDQELVARGLARSRAVAREHVDQGHVLVDGQVARKASQPVGPHAQLEDRAQERWVGRAAYKLVHALEVFPVDPRGTRCIDVGASTGGFTQVLLERGAREVVALDVGHGQLAEPVRSDPRVSDRSGTNVRYVDIAELGGPGDLVVADLSFISLTLALSPMRAMLEPGGDLITLIKPQFEVGKERLGHGGVVGSPNERRRAVGAVLERARELDLSICGLADSPIEGGSGNHEYLAWLRTTKGSPMTPAAVDEALASITHGTPIARIEAR